MIQSPSDILALTTIRLACDKRHKSVTGTGFYFAFPSLNGEPEIIPTIVTNWHVMKDAEVLHLWLHARPTDKPHVRGETSVFNVNTPLNRTIRHPDPLVDLCVMTFSPLLMEMRSRGVESANSRLSSKLIPTQEEWKQLSTVEDILMIGYPIGLWDNQNNQPIVRRGITATHPGLDFRGRKEFVIDAACFPGSSGSPVFLYDNATYRVGNSIKIGSRVKLLGILSGGPIREQIGVVEYSPMHDDPYVKFETMVNLGYVIKSTELMAFEPILQSLQRRQLVETAAEKPVADVPPT